MVSKFNLFLCMGFLLGPNLLYGQETPKKEPETIEIKANLQSSSQNSNFSKNPTGFQKEIHLDSANTRYTSLADILNREAGVRIRQYGGLGSYSTLSLRGTNPNQSKIYWNGVPINNSLGG